MVLLGMYIAGNAISRDAAEFDEGERGMSLMIGGVMAACGVVVVLTDSTDVFPPVIAEPITTLVEGLGYYVVLAYGPITVVFLTLGFGGITVAITHLLLEQYV